MFKKKRNGAEFYDTYNKLFRVIESCKTLKQFDVAMAYLELARAKYPELHHSPYDKQILHVFQSTLNEIR